MQQSDHTTFGPKSAIKCTTVTEDDMAAAVRYVLKHDAQPDRTLAMLFGSVTDYGRVA